MKTSEFVRVLIGSGTVYVVVAACSASGGGATGVTTVASTTRGNGGVEGATSTAIQSGGVVGATTRTSQSGGMTVATRSSTASSQTGGTRIGSSSSTVIATTGTGITSPVPIAQADPVSGTRLKAQYREAEDGSKEFLNYQWWDSQRQEACTFQTAVDGATRCIPTGFYFASDTYFTDLNCTIMLAFRAVSAGCAESAQPKTASAATMTGCWGIRVFALGTKFTGTIYQKSGTTCVASSSVSSYEFFAVQTEVPPSSFVAGTVKTAT